MLAQEDEITQFIRERTSMKQVWAEGFDPCVLLVLLWMHGLESLFDASSPWGLVPLGAAIEAGWQDEHGSKF